MGAVTGNLDELPGLLAELRELVREAHGAAKDLRAAIKEARQLTADAARDGEQAARQAAIAEMKVFEAHVQAEMDRSARDLNRAVAAARDHLVKALTPKIAARVLRFHRLVARLRAGGVATSWAELAAALGYFDQSHLVRDVRRFAGRTPTELLARIAPGSPAVRA